MEQILVKSGYMNATILHRLNLENDMNGQQAQDNFGASTSLSSDGKMIAIGARGADSGKG